MDMGVVASGFQCASRRLAVFFRPEFLKTYNVRINGIQSRNNVGLPGCAQGDVAVRQSHIPRHDLYCCGAFFASVRSVTRAGGVTGSAAASQAEEDWKQANVSRHEKLLDQFGGGV
jgi:hypothetical protein